MIEMFSAEEIERLKEIGALSLTLVNEDPEITAILDEAKEKVGLPVALLSVVTDGAQYFFEKSGLGGWIGDARGTPVEWSFCQHVVASESHIEVTDASTDERVKDSPLVSNDSVLCYLGVPLRSKNGQILGSFCVLGTSAHEFKDGDKELLEALSAKLTGLIEKRRED
ncbi:MAG: GAF domain-containing protein [Planctomycetota bacterium]|nr:GAF domain-containing protein [Planctomycetota bacterium]